MSRAQRKREEAKKHSQAGRPTRRRSVWSSSWLLLLLPAVLVVAVGLAVLLLRDGGASSPRSAEEQRLAALFPDYLRKAPARTQATYLYAVQNSDVLRYMPCFCGCGEHDGHKSVENCFVAQRKPDGGVTLDEHGYGCDMCIEIVRDAERLVAEGKALKAVRQFIEGKYGSIGPATNTPWPPS